MRTAFIRNNIATLIISFIIVDIITVVDRFQPAWAQELTQVSRISFFSRFPNISVARVCDRIAVAVMIWLSSYLYIRGYYSLFTLASFATGFDHPRLWRHIFDLISSAYTLRSFWGSFWHQMLRKILSVTASFPTRGITSTIRSLCCDRETPRLLLRYAKLLATFAILGAFYLWMDFMQGLEWGESGAVIFFMMMALSIVVEDIVQWVASVSSFPYVMIPILSSLSR